MSDTKHTPEPWQAVKTSFGNWLIKTNSAVICYRVDNEDDANLIASAPELLEALEALKADIYASGYLKDRESFRKARAAINKAKGEAV